VSDEAQRPLSDSEAIDALLANLRDDVQILLGDAYVVVDGKIDEERTNRCARYMLTVCCTIRDKLGSWKERYERNLSVGDAEALAVMGGKR